ncbi:MAG: AIPR family protein [bacterium]|nr:AIPR family protein [bacterium]
MATLQDFSLLNTYIEKYKKDYKLQNLATAFPLFALDAILSLQEDEMKDSITDGGNDGGIDAVYIDEHLSPAKIYFFQFKYKTKYGGINCNFPAVEIDKIFNTIKDILHKEKNLEKYVNPILYQKIKHIWNIFENENPKFVICLCSNLENNLIKAQQDRFEQQINSYQNFQIEYYNINNFVALILNKGKKQIDGKIKAIDTNYFSRIDGTVRALIANVDADELLSLVKDETSGKIKEDILNDNVRIYLQARTRINRSIKDTALDKANNYKFFYFNNGITLTCDSFTYTPSQRAPLIELTNIQIVNGGQTIHSLYDAYKEDKEAMKSITLLLRIYETKNLELSQQIAEYTNSQNPVKSRDIRSNDYMQKKLESELLQKGYFYERKKNYYKDKSKNKRLDSEKIGQVLMAFYSEMPAEAKNKKQLIFSDKYEEVFTDDLTAEKILLPFLLFDKIEGEKNKKRVKISKMKSEQKIEKESYVLYGSYYILYFLKKISEKNGLSIDYKNRNKIFNNYFIVVKKIKEFIEEEKKENAKYFHGDFFKGNKLKEMIENYISNY